MTTQGDPESSSYKHRFALDGNQLTHSFRWSQKTPTQKINEEITANLDNFTRSRYFPVKEDYVVSSPNHYFGALRRLNDPCCRNCCFMPFIETAIQDEDSLRTILLPKPFSVLNTW
jgi:hypothetical protein